MCRTSLGKREIPGAERLCRADQRRSAVGPAGRQAERPRRDHRMGGTGVGPGRWRARDRHELLCAVDPMSSRALTSLTNPTVKAVRALHLRKARDETGLFVAEGLKTVTEGVETGHAPKILLYGAEAADHPLTKKAVQATLAENGEVIEVTEAILAKVSRRDNPQAVVGVFEQVFRPLAVIEPQAARCWVARHPGPDPGNPGTIQRHPHAPGR